jgi:N-acetylglucosaminyldiphosphoundecaprenol N-acetyl-beta-D-mannosaminyltransferase
VASEPRAKTQAPTVHVGEVPFRISTLADAVDWLHAAAKRSMPVSVRLANAYCVALADEDPRYKALLRDSGVNFPDGTPVVWFMRRALRRRPGGGHAGRVRGPSLFTASIARSARDGTRVFFLGASQETLDALVSWARATYPTLQVSGSYSPPFAPVTEAFLDGCAGAIEAVGADLVWVGLGTPKQDYVSTALAARLGIPCAGVGAAFDFAAGSVAEAPVWVQNSGFEWLYRLLSEPRRLWRRYFFGNVRFLIAAARGASSAS